MNLTTTYNVRVHVYALDRGITEDSRNIRVFAWHLPCFIGGENNMTKLPIYALIFLLFSCGAAGGGGASGGAVGSNGQTGSIFQNWNLAIPNSDISTFINAGAAPSGALGVQPIAPNQQNYTDIMTNRTLNLSGLRYGENALSENWGSRPISAGGAALACTLSYTIIISVTFSGSITLIKRYSNVCGAEPTEVKLYYSYSIGNDGKLTVCGYNDANRTLLRGCVTSN